MDVTAVDLFCGVGGLTYGLEEAGISVAAGIDVDPDCEYPYEANTDAAFVREDLSELAREAPDRVEDLFDDGTEERLLAGCAPCQPFSSLTHDGSDHEKWGLLRAFERLVERIEPEYVVMENVPAVQNHEPFTDFVATLEERGYWTNGGVSVYCPQYEVPQERRRLVLLASTVGPVEMVPPARTDPENYPTVKETIDHLPEIDAGETHGTDRLHTARALSETNLDRMRHSKPGETWERWREVGREDLVLDCHEKASGDSYKAPYGIMESDEPAPTITTQFYNYGSGRFGHYDSDQLRALSLREGALLQTFPEDYDFVPEDREAHFVTLGRLIGNAVPPKLAEFVGESLREVVTHATLDEYV